MKHAATTVGVAVTLGLLTWGMPVSAQESSPEERALFEREIRPLLVDACGSCHGPKKQESGLRVDSREALLRGGDSGAAIKPGDPAASLLAQVVRHEHDIKMPPDGKLRPDQIRSLEHWIQAGAPWPTSSPVGNETRGGPLTPEERAFWSFQPLREVAIPEVRQTQMATSPLDRFIVEQWERRGLTAAPEANRRALLRRVTVDLTGLPPTRDEIRDFVSDQSPDALARVIDRLLASPRYGERYGRHWLDVVRYADTAGDGADYPVREAYLYRNYVIQAWNADKPYDEFLREQIAGDILARQSASEGAITPERYREQVIATGFLAVSKRFGYNINTEFQHLDIADTIEGLGRSVLGLSIGCARCHDHKYDPVNMMDYYSLYGILASSQFSFPGGEEYKRPHNLVPLVEPAEQQRREAERAARLAELDAQLKQFAADREVLVARLPGESVSPERAFETQPLNQAPTTPFFQAGRNRVLEEAQSELTHLVARGTRGVRLMSGAPNDGLRLELKPGLSATTTPRAYFSIDFCGRSSASDAAGSHRFYLGRGAIASTAWEASLTADEIHVRNGNQWTRIASLVPDHWYNLRLEIDLTTKKYSGRVGRPGEWIEFRELDLMPGWDGVIDTFFNDGIGHVTGPRPTCDLDNLVLQSQPVAAASEQVQLTPEELAAIRERLAQIDASTADVKRRRDSLAAEPLFELAYAVMEGQPRHARIQKRGEPDRPGDEAARRNLEIFGGQPIAHPDSQSGRLDLALWLTSPDHPLTWRVIVNRLWQHHFGSGIVRTSSDFGTRGEPPTHPELLDYLARQLLDYRGSLKRLQRDMLLTSAYRLASSTTPENLEADPSNRWLWRYPRRPLDAESIRDGMLELSGDLDHAMPGPHPFPSTDKWSFTIHYPFHAEYDSRHRSVYLMVQRARKHPYLSLFDGADPNLSTAERLATTTPTQALYLMNAAFIHERSESLARRVTREGDSDDDRARWLIEAVTAREPTDEEVAGILGFLERHRTLSDSKGTPPSDSQPVPATPSSAVKQTGGAASSPAHSVSTWAAACRALLVSNAYLFVD